MGTLLLPHSSLKVTETILANLTTCITHNQKTNEQRAKLGTIYILKSLLVTL